MSNPFECKSPLSGSVSLQLDLDDTLMESPRVGTINTDSSLLAEITRLREENRALKEEIKRLKSVQMVSVATQTGPDEPMSPTLLVPQQRPLSPPMQPLKKTGTLSLAPPLTSLPSLEERSKLQKLAKEKEEKENEKEKVEKEKVEEKIENDKKEKEKEKENENENDDENKEKEEEEEEENIPLTFNAPPKYSKDCSCKNKKTNIHIHLYIYIYKFEFHY